MEARDLIMLSIRNGGLFFWYKRPTWVDDLVTGAHDGRSVLELCLRAEWHDNRQDEGSRADAEHGFVAWIGARSQATIRHNGRGSQTTEMSWHVERSV